VKWFAGIEKVIDRNAHFASESNRAINSSLRLPHLKKRLVPRLVRSPEPLAVLTRDVLTSLAFTGKAFGVRWTRRVPRTALDSFAKLWVGDVEK
jgi:hypothetical protein